MGGGGGGRGGGMEEGRIMCSRVCVCACVRMCVCACACVCLCLARGKVQLEQALSFFFCLTTPVRAAALAFPAPADGPARVQAEADKDTSDRGKRALETAKVAGESGPGRPANKARHLACCQVAGQFGVEGNLCIGVCLCAFSRIRSFTTPVLCCVLSVADPAVKAAAWARFTAESAVSTETGLGRGRSGRVGGRVVCAALPGTESRPLLSHAATPAVTCHRFHGVRF
jgi:hypothetical protein